ncbi:MAG: ATP-dependent DNA helicase RecG [Flavobacterium sp. BFFFF2]|nr:MAG: ATP-dependent DNA helicase RecG [Flavobacterium sp. BFFFF2]
MTESVLHTPIEYLKGVGPQRGALLRKELNIHTYADLLRLFPNRYIDRTRFFKIQELVVSTAEVQIIGKIHHLKTVEQKKGKRLVATFTDGTGEMELIWFQGIKWIQEQIKLNEVYVIFGKLTYFNHQFSMTHPDMEVLSAYQSGFRPALQSIYPSTENLGKRGVSNKMVSKMMQQLFVESGARFDETLPEYLCKQQSLVSLREALIHIHFPKSAESLSQAQYRLKFEELFWIQLQLLLNNRMRKHKIKGHPFSQVGTYFLDFYNHHLPFELTDAQKRVLKEIRNDLGQAAQMNRLLQGDVGSGKTIVAFMCMLLALDNGFQSCLMAPTEILAQQHYQSLSTLAETNGLQIGLLTGSTKTAERKRLAEALLDGSLHILIGTHALLEDHVQFKQLGLAIIDEQHRFGVEQRAKLWKKNQIPPHILVMTATPIPRTLAMSLYGDLDISVIDGLPPGRKPIQTVHQSDSNRLKVWKFLRDEIAKGRQVYIVYPLIQESEALDYKDLMDGYESISRDFPLPQYSISILHGQMKPAEKEAEMKRFVEGKTQIMVATTVIEVGVNVPNASVMVIESAERFGLSQLHQLRGRVGRGAEQSYCILMTGFKMSNDSKTRIETMCRTQDGFEIADVDLKLRGPGDLMGKQQSGVLQLQIADLVKDSALLAQARQVAQALLHEDPALEQPVHQRIRETYMELSRKKSFWNLIS